jgi:hypothetical protein
VDVVHVAVVNTAHRDAALAMIAGGKAVLVEKTFAMSEAQAQEIISAAREKVRLRPVGTARCCSTQTPCSNSCSLVIHAAAGGPLQARVVPGRTAA